jgi:hypothetical protein
MPGEQALTDLTGGYIGAILTRDIGYTCEGIIDNALIKEVIFAEVKFVSPIYLVSILNSYPNER